PWDHRKFPGVYSTDIGVGAGAGDIHGLRALGYLQGDFSQWERGNHLFEEIGGQRSGALSVLYLRIDPDLNADLQRRRGKPQAAAVGRNQDILQDRNGAVGKDRTTHYGEAAGQVFLFAFQSEGSDV